MNLIDLPQVVPTSGLIIMHYQIWQVQLKIFSRIFTFSSEFL